jgi:hypothetical protein
MLNLVTLLLAMRCRLALYLLKEPASCESLLRRLAIICLEDGLLHPQLPLVVWAMLAVVSLKNTKLLLCQRFCQRTVVC